MYAIKLVDTLRPGDVAELAPAAMPRVFGKVVSVENTVLGTEVVWRQPEDNKVVMSVFAANAAVKVKTGSRRKKRSIH